MLSRLHRNHKYLLLAFVIYSLFFINKAFHIDDPFTIDIAKAINKIFFSVPSSFSTNPILFSNPRLMGYYYAPIIRLFGEKEAWLHIFNLPFSLLAISSMFFISLRFTGKSLLPTLWLVVSPAFIIMSHSIMLDIPLLGFFLFSMIVFINGIDSSNNKLLLLSGVLAGITILIKYSGLLLIPLMLIYALLFSKKRCSFLFLFIPLAIFFLWGAHNLICYKKFGFTQVLGMRLNLWSWQVIAHRMLACFSFISGTSIAGLFIVPFLLRNKSNFCLFLISLPVCLCFFLCKDIFSEYSILEKSFLLLFFVASVFLTLTMFKTIFLFFLKKTRDKDKLFLSLWFIMLLFFTIFIQFVAARFVLLLFPPLFLYLHNELVDFKAHSSNFFKKMVIFSISITFIISTVLAVGDYFFAEIYRNFTRFLKEESFVNKKIYFCPQAYSYYDAWGYAYYLNKYYPEKENYKIIKSLDKIDGDVFFVSPSNLTLPIGFEDKCTADNSTIRKILIAQYNYDNNVIMHNMKYQAGFYSDDWGLLPFRVSLQGKTIERFSIYKLIPNG